MSSLYGTLNVALSTLQAQQAGIDTASNNLANVNTPGYARQRAVLGEIGPLEGGGPGGGVSVEKIASIRDKVLELRLHQETQAQAGVSSFLAAAQQAQSQFNDTQGAGVQSAISGFFASLQQLSTDPANLPARQSVLLAAQNLGQVFDRTTAALTGQQAAIDRSVVDTLAQVNTLTSQIAGLNLRIEQAAAVDAGSLEDQRTQAIRQLSQLIDVNVIPTEHGGVTVATADGAALVVGPSQVKLDAQLDPATGFQHVFSQGADITSSVQAGQLGGDFKARDQLVPGLLQQLKTISAGIANAVNAQHHLGADLNGAAGGDFFLGSTFNVAITDPAKIAASSDGAAGSNGNVAALAALVRQNIAGGASPADAYTSLVAGLGSTIAGATAEQDASNLTLQQLQTQRSSTSGVNLDEEAASLIQFQRAYQAAARVASVVNDLTAAAINLGSATTV